MRTETGLVIVALLSAGGAQAAKDSCFECHSVMEGMSIPFQNDIHYRNGISCADCHGGDPGSDDQNVSMSAARGFKVRVTRQASSGFCAGCHSDAAVMHRHNPQQRVDQMALYRTSVHARAAGSDPVAATCIDCHGVHNIRAAADPQSAVAPARLAATCGKCHADAASMFKSSAHAAVFTTAAMPSCITCHAAHATSPASGEMLAGGRAVCANCHEPDTKGGKTAAAMERTLEQEMMAAFSAMPAPAAGENASPEQIRAMIAAMQKRMQKPRSLVHSLNAAAVKAAAQAAAQQ
jgi:predicted CXXCH cytochrome family protein